MDAVISTDGNNAVDDSASSSLLLKLSLEDQEAMSNAKEDGQHDSKANASYLVDSLEGILELLAVRAARLDAVRMTNLVERLRSFMRNCQKLIEELELRAIVLRTTSQIEGIENLKNFRRAEEKPASEMSKTDSGK